MKKLFLGLLISLIMVISVGLVMAAGNGWTGYKKNNIFVGTGYQWCEQKYGWDATQCEDFLGVYANDKITMKWNQAWEDGDESGWTCDAWTDNEWNGMFPGGSGETWHYKIVWVGPELESSSCWKEGGYPVWSEFEIILSHGTAGGEHIWDAHAIPTGYGN